MPDFNDLAVVVCSCDKYKSVWDPYFTLFEKYFTSPPKDIYLLTEIAEVPFEISSTWCEKSGGVHVINSTEKCWSKRIKDGLRQIKNQYILFCLEDYFLQDFVKTDTIEKALCWMNENENISAVRIFPFWESFTNEWPKYKDNFFVIDRNYKERVNAQAAIWRRERLIEILNNNETAWQFEVLASNRSRKDPYLYLGYHAPAELKGIFPYQIAQVNGCGITSGKWLWNNPVLFEKNNIECDFSELGIMSEKKWIRNYKSKLLRVYRRVVKFFRIVAIKIKNKEKIDVKAIINSSMSRTMFVLLSPEEYQERANGDLQLIP